MHVKWALTQGNRHMDEMEGFVNELVAWIGGFEEDFCAWIHFYKNAGFFKIRDFWIFFIFLKIYLYKYRHYFEFYEKK